MQQRPFVTGTMICVGVVVVDVVDVVDVVVGVVDVVVLVVLVSPSVVFVGVSFCVDK